MNILNLLLYKQVVECVMNILETGRLYIREFQLTDADFIFELMNTAEYLQNIGDRNIKTKDCAKNFLSERLCFHKLLVGVY